jgi:hypothetical protein
MSKLITEIDISNAAKNNITTLTIEKGTVVTPLAKDAARSLGITLIQGTVEIPATSKPTSAAVASSTCEILALMEQYTKTVWEKEPEDLISLRKQTLPPMGNMPCVLYCSFNLFWLGETMQIWRLAAQKKTAPLKSICFSLAQEFARHASRLSKWHVPDTQQLVNKLQTYFCACGPKSETEAIEVLTKAMLALDRMQNWIDSAIPWSRMDKSLGGLNSVWNGGGQVSRGNMNEEQMTAMVENVIKKIIEGM